MIEKLISNIAVGRFEQAEELLSPIAFEALRDALYVAAYDDRDFCVYAFICFLLAKSPTKNNQDIAHFITGHAINYLAGAYEVAVHHARSIFEMALPEDPGAGELLLQFYFYPEQPLTTQEAISIANTILVQEPENHVALNVLELAKKRGEEEIYPSSTKHNEIERLIKAGLFSKALELLPSMDIKDLYQIILYLGCEEQNLCAYAFTWVLIQQQESAELHYIAYRIATLAWPFLLKGCDAAGAFHLRRAMQLDPLTKKYAEHFLMLHTALEKNQDLISDDEAEIVAKKTLDQHYHYSNVATYVLKKMGRYDQKYDN